MSYGLGRGLNSLIPPKKIIQSLSADFNKSSGESRLVDLPTSRIKPNPKQPRENFGYQKLEDLINSIKEHGIIQPLIVSEIDKDNYELIAGERRLRAAKILNLKTVPAVIRTAKDQEKLEIALIENIQREDLNPIEEANAFKKLMEEFNLTQEEVAKRVGRSRPSIANTLRLLGLPDKIINALRDGKLTESHARILLRLDGEKKQLEYFDKILKNDFTTREAEGAVKKAKGIKLPKNVPAISAKEESLRNALGTKVEIKKRGRGGQIIVYFYSEEDLGKLFKKFLKK